jgi:5-methyltetrahydropteroyltriglutamate--homocysteine methyltransferase
MKRSQTRILTTHTGSLPRPRELTELYAARLRGEAVDAATIARAGREAVRAAVRNQLRTGVDVINNGEQERESFFLYLRERLTGLGGSWQRPPRADVERYPGYKELLGRMASLSPISPFRGMPQALGEVRYDAPETIALECATLKDVLAESGERYSEAFMSAPSPGILFTAIQNKHYDTDEAYMAALGRAVQVEYETIARSGFVLQLDAPDLGIERHMTFADKPLSVFLEFVELVVETINRALESVPRDRVRMHVCWGNSASPHDCDVPLKEILPILLKARVSGLVLPFASPRHAHEIKSFKELPLGEDQLLVVGVIDQLSNVIEHEEAIADRLELAARMIGDPRRMLAGVDCGFDTTAGTGGVAADVVWAKLASMVKGAGIASERLFGGKNAASRAAPG